MHLNQSFLPVMENMANLTKSVNDRQTMEPLVNMVQSLLPVVKMWSDEMLSECRTAHFDQDDVNGIKEIADAMHVIAYNINNFKNKTELDEKMFGIYQLFENELRTVQAAYQGMLDNGVPGYHNSLHNLDAFSERLNQGFNQTAVKLKSGEVIEYAEI